jgi:hypothetical protein
MPVLRRISGRIQVPESVGLGVNNRNIVARSFIQRVAFRSDGETQQLFPWTTRVRSLKVRVDETQDRTGDRSAIIWVECLESDWG